MTYIKQSVPRAKGNPGIGIQVRDTIVIYDVEDIAFFPPRNNAGVLLEGDIVSVPGRYAIGLYQTPGTMKITSGAEGDTDEVGFKPQVVFKHPGNSLEVREFKANYVNRRVIVVILHCSGEPADVIGDLCNPCVITPSYTGDNDSNSNEFTIAQVSKGNDIGMYTGTITLEEPVAVVDKEAATINYVADGQYQLQPSSVAFSSIDGGHHGSVITILGTPGVTPEVEASSTILLRGGRQFSAAEGCQLTLRAFESADKSIVWIEQSRYEVA